VMETVVVSQTEEDGGIADLIARCQASSSDCTPLCQHVLPKSGDEPIIKSCKLVMEDGGLAVSVVYGHVCAGGRCPEGLAPAASTRAKDPLGGWLAANAHLEAASIEAFEILAAELGAHHAPAPLIQASRAAIADERRHAQIVGRLAVGRGAELPSARVTRGPVRDIESVARENAVEGCVRETHAALLAYRQARTAADPAIRSAMTAIAADETRHAALAWAVDDWSRSLLAPPARRRVRDARREAIDQLINAQLTHAPLAGLLADARAQAGLPDQEAATRMAVELGAALV